MLTTQHGLADSRSKLTRTTGAERRSPYSVPSPGRSFFAISSRSPQQSSLSAGRRMPSALPRPPMPSGAAGGGALRVALGAVFMLPVAGASPRVAVRTLADLVGLGRETPGR